MNHILALVLSLGLSPAAAQADRDLVKVNGTPIRQSEVIQRLLERYGNETLDEMVDELLVRQEIDAKKIKVSPEEIDKRLAKMRSRFPDEKTFEQQLAQQGSSMDKLKKDMNDGLAMEKLIIAAKHLKVGDEELRKAFEKHQDDLGTPEGVHMRHILVATQAEADDLVKQIKGGADFKALAKEKSLDPAGKANGGEDGVVTKAMMPPDIAKGALGMKDGDVQVFPVGGGFSVLQTLERHKASPASFDKVKDDLRELLLQQKMKQALPSLSADLRKKAEIVPQGQ
jgi:foldase protein PrsA